MLTDEQIDAIVRPLSFAPDTYEVARAIEAHVKKNAYPVILSALGEESVRLQSLAEELTKLKEKLLAAQIQPPIAESEDPRVQRVYEILTSSMRPPEDEHWEGFVARRIVDALAVPTTYLVTLNWSKPYPPDDHIRYDHVVADTLIGEFSIEWKSWKEHDAYCVYLGGQYLTSAPNLDAAKQVASNHLLSVAKALQSDDQWLAVPTADGDPLDTDSPLWQAILKYKRSPEGYHSEQAAKAVDLEILRLVTSSNEVPSVTLDHTLDHLYSGLHSISKSFESSSHCYDDDGAHYQALLDTMQFLRSFSVKDAGLFQRLSQCRQIREHWGSRWSICIEGREPASYSLEDFRTAVDNATRDQ